MATTANEALIASWRLSLHDKSPRTIDLYLRELRRFARLASRMSRSARGVPPGRRDMDPASCRPPAEPKPRSGRGGLSCGTSTGGSSRRRSSSSLRWRRCGYRSRTRHRPMSSPRHQLRSLLGACEGRSFEDRRDAALIRFMAATGLRVSETCSTRGRRRRSRRSGSRRCGPARATRRGWSGSTPPPPKPSTGTCGSGPGTRYARRRDLWIGFRGPLTRKGVPAILDKRAAIAGIGHVHAHQLRHTWAHRWLTERRRRTGHDAPRRVGQRRRHASATEPPKRPTEHWPHTTTSTRWGNCDPGRRRPLYRQQGTVPRADRRPCSGPRPRARRRSSRPPQRRTGH